MTQRISSSTIFRRWVVPGLTCLILIVAIVFLRKELSSITLLQLRESLTRITPMQLLACGALALVNYGILVIYEWLANRELGKNLSWAKTTMVSFLGYSMSYNFGPLLGGSTIRTRLYGSWGYSATEIVAIIAMLGATFWIGLLTLAGVLFAWDPIAMPKALALPWSVRPMGIAILAGVAIWLGLTAWHRTPITLGSFELKLPSLSSTIYQMLASVAEMLTCAGCLYVLLPAGAPVNFIHFTEVFLLAVLAMGVTQIPGGLGVFEFVVISQLPGIQPDQLLATLLTFRLMYFIIPLAISLLTLAVYELAGYRGSVSKASASISSALSMIGPTVVSFGTLVVGAILVLSGATPALEKRFEFLVGILPLQAVEASHFLSSLTGTCLLVLARPLQRRMRAAWWITVGLLVAGTLFSLMKGLDFEEAFSSIFLLTVLLACRREFYRVGSIMTPSWTTQYMLMVAVVVISSISLGLFAYKHIDYSNTLWWQFEFDGHASRFLRAELGAILLLLVFGLSKLLGSGRVDETHAPTIDEISKATPIVAKSKRAASNLVYLRDKALLFHPSGESFLMYAVKGRSWVVMGDPVGPQEQWPELIGQFRDLVDRYDGWPVFYQVSAETMGVYVDQGFSLLKLGEEARVKLSDFNLEGKRRQDFRTARNKHTKQGFTFKVLAPNEITPYLAQLKSVSDTWLKSKNGKEKGFSLGFYDEDYLRRSPCAIVEKDGVVHAFASLWMTDDPEEIAIDLMRYLGDDRSGIMDYLFTELLMWAKAKGYVWFHLGMAPLSGIEGGKRSPLWNQVASLVYRYGESYYSFEGLRNYKNKFDPVWTARYLASPGGLALPRILTDMTTLISRGRKNRAVVIDQNDSTKSSSNDSEVNPALKASTLEAPADRLVDEPLKGRPGAPHIMQRGGKFESSVRSL